MRATAAGFVVVGALAGWAAGAQEAAPPPGSAGEPAPAVQSQSEAPAEPEDEAAPAPGTSATSAVEEPRGRGGRTWDVIRRDYSQFYSRGGLLRIGAGLAVAGVVANTDADQELYDWYHEEAGDGSGSWAEAADQLGEPAVGLGIAALGTAFLGLVPEGEDESAAARWVRRTTRGYVVGLPAMYYLQQIAGSGRPDEPEGSSWQIFGETHGVSGHAFLAGVPLLTLARSSDNRLVQGAAVVASVATAWARIEEEEHYPSQAFLGWYLAWAATGAVARADAAAADERAWSVAPVVVPDGGGLVVHASF